MKNLYIKRSFKRFLCTIFLGSSGNRCECPAQTSDGANINYVAFGNILKSEKYGF